MWYELAQRVRVVRLFSLYDSTKSWSIFCPTYWHIPLHAQHTQTHHAPSPTFNGIQRRCAVVIRMNAFVAGSVISIQFDIGARTPHYTSIIIIPRACSFKATMCVYFFLFLFIFVSTFLFHSLLWSSWGEENAEKIFERANVDTKHTTFYW